MTSGPRSALAASPISDTPSAPGRSVAAGARVSPGDGASRRSVALGLTIATVLVVGAALAQAPSAGPFTAVLRRADLAWTAAAGAASVVPVLAMTATLRAMTPFPLPWLRTTLVQVATSFTNALAPAGAGGAALNARYLQCRGLPLAAALGVVAVVQASSIVATVGLLVVVLAVSGDPTSAASRFPVALVASVLVASGAAAVLAARSQAVRRGFGERVAQPFRRAWPQLKQSLESRARLVSLLTAQLAVTAGLAVTLWCCLQAFSIELSWTAALIALLAGSTIGSAAPVPGGIGTVEAATAGALLAAGVPAADALAVALLYRLVTFWTRLPIGWFCLLWLRRQGDL